MPPDEGFRRDIHQGIFPRETVWKHHQHRARDIVEASRSDFALLVEGELFS